LILINRGKILTSRVEFLKLFINTVPTTLPDDFIDGYFSRLEGTLEDVIKRAIRKCCDENSLAKRVAFFDEFQNEFSLSSTWHPFNKSAVFGSENLLKGFLLIWIEA
jgi:hypothetical protein